MGISAMSTPPRDIDMKRIRPRHQGTRCCEKMPHWMIGHIVNAIDLFDVKALHHAFFHHDAPAPIIFLGRLKNQRNASCKTPCFTHVFCSAQQHGRMPIMTTGMHQTVPF